MGRRWRSGERLALFIMLNFFVRDTVFINYLLGF